MLGKQHHERLPRGFDDLGERREVADVATTDQLTMDQREQQYFSPSVARHGSRESRGYGANQAGSGLMNGEAIVVNMSRLADVLGCGRDELLQSLRKEATSEAEGVAVDGAKAPATLDQLHGSAMYPPPGVRQALMTTVSRAPDAGQAVEEAEVPRPLWLLGGAGGKTIVELVLLNLMRGGVDRVVIVVGQKDGDKMREAVSRTRAVVTGKVTIEFLEDTGEPSRQFHAKSILRAREAFDSPFLFVTSDHLYHPGLLHRLAGQDLGDDGGCVLVEDATGPKVLKDMAPTAVFVRRAPEEVAPARRGSLSTSGDDAAASAEKQSPSRRVMAIGRREQGKRQRWDGVECGAILLSPEIFDTLSDLGRRRRYFTLADGLDIMAGGGLLRSVSTEGKPWLALETKAQLKRGIDPSLVQKLVGQAEPFPWESNNNIDSVGGGGGGAAPPPSGSTPPNAAAAAAAAAAGDEEPGRSFSMSRRLSLNLDAGATPDAEGGGVATEDDESSAAVPDFKGFIVPVEAGPLEGVSSGGPVSAADDPSSQFLARGFALKKRVSLEGVTVQVEEPDPEAGEAGAGTVTLPWSEDAAGDVGFIVAVPGEGGVEELVFAVPELPQQARNPTGGGGGLLGACFEPCFGGGGGGDVDSDDEGGAGLLGDDSDDEDYDYNCLGGGILSGILPELPTEMPSDILSVRVTTEVLAEKAGEEPTLAVQVIVDKRVPVLGWVLMVSALFGLAAMAPLGDLLSKMSPDTLPAVYPVWRYSCSAVMYSPWFLLIVAGSKSARAELRDWSRVMPIIFAGAGLAGWGLCFYCALNFVSASMVALLASLTPMCLVVWRGVTGDAVHMLEIIGVLLAMVGGVVSTVGEGGGDEGADADASDAAAAVVVVGGEDLKISGEGQALGIALGLGAACCGGLYILNAKAARNKVEVSHFAFIASVVPAAICAIVLLAAYGGSEEGRVALFGPSGLLGWTQSPGLALAQIVTSLLGDIVGNFGFYLLLKYISPLVVSLASLTVPLLAVVEGLMLGVVSPPGVLFGVGAFLILAGAGTASMVTLLPHTEVFDATGAVKAGGDKSPIPTASLYSSSPPPPPGYGSVNSSNVGAPARHTRSSSASDAGKGLQQQQQQQQQQHGAGEARPLLSTHTEGKGMSKSGVLSGGVTAGVSPQFK